jgi:hypothetical protein
MPSVAEVAEEAVVFCLPPVEVKGFDIDGLGKRRESCENPFHCALVDGCSTTGKPN